jgi:hypothetical protein
VVEPRHLLQSGDLVRQFPNQRGPAGRAQLLRRRVLPLLVQFFPPVQQIVE